MNNSIGLMTHALPLLLKGAVNTILISVASIAGALLLGLIIALMRTSNVRFLKGISRIYVSFFRGTPLLIQLLILYSGFSTIILINGWQAAIIGLILHFASYISESLRASILSIDKGQWEGAMSLGMKRSLILKQIILPQAWRNAIPPVWNSLIDIIKASSLASVVTVPELTQQADEISAASWVILPILIEAALIYWGLTTVLSFVQTYLERNIAKKYD